MTNVLTNPDQFFAELSTRDESLKTPFLIVLVAATIAAISSAMMLSTIAPTLPEEAAVVSDVFPVIGAITGLLMLFILWLLYTGVFYTSHRHNLRFFKPLKP